MPDPVLFTPEDREKQLQELKIPLDQIASLYRGRPLVRDCECIGLDCLKPWCPEWWKYFFIEFDAELLAEMVEKFLFEPEEEEPEEEGP